MGKTYKRGSRDTKFDDGFSYEKNDIGSRKKKDKEKRVKAKEKRFIEDSEEE